MYNSVGGEAQPEKRTADETVCDAHRGHATAAGTPYTRVKTRTKQRVVRNTFPTKTKRREGEKKKKEAIKEGG